MLTRGKVILFYPPYDGPPLGAPLCLLALASTLRRANFEVLVIDAAIDPDYRTHIECESVDALCLGISVLTGPMIKGAVEVAAAIKSDVPWLPIIFGGWHPTLLPDETLSEPFVDVVVRGQGEITLVEVAEALLQKRSLAQIPGVSWKSNGQRKHNPDRRVEPLDALPVPAFDLTDFDAYERLSGAQKNWICYQRRVPLCVQLLHRHGLLQAAIQCPLGRAGCFRAHRPCDQVSGRRSRPARLQLSRPT